MEDGRDQTAGVGSFQPDSILMSEGGDPSVGGRIRDEARTSVRRGSCRSAPERQEEGEAC